jgi:molybdate transport system regulatory protein
MAVIRTSLPSKPAAPSAKGRKPLPSTRITPVWQILSGAGDRLGDGHLELLERIGECGSLREASRLCGISYRTAWSRVGELNRGSPEPLVLSVNGGAKGGESRLTEAGQRLVDTHLRAERSFQEAMEAGGIDPAQLDSWLRFLRRISMKTSARNQYHGTVAALRRGAVNAEVDIQLPGGIVISSQITLPSVDRLGLEVGREAWALVKASWVLLAAGEEEPAVSARNRLKGKVSSIVRGAVNSEVVVALPGGQEVVAVVLNESVKTLGLRTGSVAWALIKAGSVIVGTL